MPIIATTDIKRISDIIISEDMQQRISRDDVEYIGDVKQGQLLKESATAGKYEAITANADLGSAVYIALFNSDDHFGDRTAGLARLCKVRTSKIEWPADVDDAGKAAAIAALKPQMVIFRD